MSSRAQALAERAALVETPYELRSEVIHAITLVVRDHAPALELTRFMAETQALLRAHGTPWHERARLAKDLRRAEALQAFRCAIDAIEGDWAVEVGRGASGGNSSASRGSTPGVER